MPAITFANRIYQSQPEETLLECLLRHDVHYPHSCMSGSCHTCLTRATAGEIAPAAQTGLKDTEKALGYFLACTLVPQSDLCIELPKDAGQKFQTTVVEKSHLNDHIVRLLLERPENYDYHAGQFFTLYNPEGIGRPYSLASVPALDAHLEAHIRCYENGRVSRWIHDALRVGEKVSIGPACGSCFYLPGEPERSLLLAATGSGLAPLQGILRDALHHRHSGRIHLFHGSSTANGLYQRRELEDLSTRHGNFHYTPCVSQDSDTRGLVSGHVEQIIDQTLADLKNWKVYLCGNPGMVNATKRKAFLRGAAFSDIYADPFTPAPAA